MPNLKRFIAAGLALSVMLALSGLSAGAQQQPDNPPANPLGNLSTQSDEPIQVNADSLEVRDNDKKAVFRGNVVVVQGDMTMRTIELWVDYEGETDAKDEQKIKRLEAKGKVLVTTKDQETSADWAIYEVKTEKVTIGGNVVLTQGTNVINGTKLIVDLKNNRTYFDSPQRGGRVQAIFTPNSTAKPGAAQKPSN